MNIGFTDEIDFVTFVWRRYNIDLKGFSEEQLIDIKIEFILTFIDAPEVNPFGYMTWATTPAFYLKDPTRVVKLQYKKYMPITNTRINKIHPSKFKRIFKTKKHV